MLLAQYFGLLIFLAVGCVATGSAIVIALGYENDLNSWILAASVNVVAGGQLCLLAIRCRSPKASVMIPLIIAGWRMMVIIAAVVIASATKWPNTNFFLLSLLGCYFPFLVLESWLSMRRANQSYTTGGDD